MDADHFSSTHWSFFIHIQNEIPAGYYVIELGCGCPIRKTHQHISPQKLVMCMEDLLLVLLQMYGLLKLLWSVNKCGSRTFKWHTNQKSSFLSITIPHCCRVLHLNHIKSPFCLYIGLFELSFVPKCLGMCVENNSLKVHSDLGTTIKSLAIGQC
jgi:hypothetical protein